MKNYIIGIVLLLVAGFLMLDPLQWQPRGEPSNNGSNDPSSSGDSNQSDGTIPSLDPSPKEVEPRIAEGNASPALPVATPITQAEEKLEYALENDYSLPVFSNHTGGIREIHLKKHGRLSKDYNMTHEGESLMSLAFEDEEGRVLKESKPGPYELVEKTDRKILYRWESPGKLRVEREYVREANSSYVIQHQTRVTKLGDSSLSFDRMRLHLGSAFQIPRLYNPFDSSETYLNVGYYNAGAPLSEGCSCAECSGRIDGEAEEFFQYNEMEVAGQWDSRTLAQTRWACVNNQFFVNVVRPETDLANARVGWRIKDRSDSTPENEVKGVEGRLSFPLGRLEPGVPKNFSFHVYAGPKDYVGLSELKFEQKKVMQFGVFWWLSEPFSWLLNKLHFFLGSYGLAIIALTILVKSLLWPLTAKATRSQKKMQALQEPMGKLKEKHKGNSQKLNQEMMKFYKENKVNPFAGCWPILIQIPIFLSMFWMLRSAAELYGQGFLWANDLSEQDSVSVLQGFSINLLPILMVATQWFQMKLNPMQMGPEMSDAQRINAKMMRFMPFMFLIFLYFFSSSLVLYWTIQNLMTILQTLITKRGPLAKEEAKPSIAVSSEEDEEDEPVRNELSDEERKYRNLLGLRAKGPVDGKLLERNYKERLRNYSPTKLEGMSEARREQAMKKKDRLEVAYEFLQERIDKQT
ncbi:MAG: membrane protein insertase YidC [Opitutae bacterium]|nr:membrane protein insertase YidC [Opitutae bacterium]